MLGFFQTYFLDRKFVASRCIFLGFTALSDQKWANIYLETNCQSELNFFQMSSFINSSYLYYNPKGCYDAKLHKKLATIKDKLFRDQFRLLLCYHSWSHCFHYFVEKSFFTIFQKNCQTSVYQAFGSYYGSNF